MARPPGLPKTGGRTIGTPNKLSGAVAEKLATLGCDPIEGLAKIAMNPATKAELKFRCYAELAQYICPKRKALDIGSESDRNITFTIEHIGAGAISS